MYTYKYPRPALTADCLVVGIGNDGERFVLLVKRGHEPYEGCWALPGGFMEMEETLEACAQRELAEETLADPDAPEAWRRENYSYLLGSELLVAPVVEPGAAERRLWLPRGSWVHLWTGEAFDGGAVTVPAPLGQPPVFYKRRGPWAPFFEELRRTLAEKA